jgi:hypothetical protein
MPARAKEIKNLRATPFVVWIIFVSHNTRACVEFFADPQWKFRTRNSTFEVLRVWIADFGLTDQSEEYQEDRQIGKVERIFTAETQRRRGGERIPRNLRALNP